MYLLIALFNLTGFNVYFNDINGLSLFLIYLSIELKYFAFFEMQVILC